MTGDPSGDGSTRVVTQNNAGATYWVGKQAGGPSSEFEPFWDKPGAIGFYDYGSLTMVRVRACVGRVGFERAPPRARVRV